MLEEMRRIDERDFENLFKKKFQNFCAKSPLRLSFSILPSGNGVLVEEAYLGWKKQYDFDFSIADCGDLESLIKQNIYLIRQDWEKEGLYPIIEQTFTKSYSLSLSEVDELIKSGVDKKEAMLATRDETTTKRFTLTKVILSDNRKEIFIKNEYGDQFSFLVKDIPIILLIDKIRDANSIGDYVGAYEIFEKYTDFKASYNNGASM